MTPDRYNHQEIEKKWQKRWLDDGVFSAKTPTSPPSGATRHLPSTRGGRAYVLDMFPYPSGDGLHVGHPIGYIATDIYARYLWMKGESVLHPMGWDAFGLPTENAAIKKGVHPREVTAKNIANFKRQIQSLGFSYDWEREINTTDPAYYKWTQWIFLQLFKRGLAYEKEAPIWWCPKDKTGLANEEVINGKCERCGTAVEKKMLKQWMLKITKYADRLLEGLERVDWPEGIKTLQRNWIGKSEGVEISFELVADRAVENTVKVFTTRPDTLFGATYLVLSPEHELVAKITTDKQKMAVEKYVKSVAAKSDLERTALEKEKTGVFTGAYAVNPVNKEKIPVWIADYVLASYGTGAIMAVPGHDERDSEFAKKFELPIVPVIGPASAQECWYFGLDPKHLSKDEAEKYQNRKDGKIYFENEGPGTKPVAKVFDGEGILINSGEFSGMLSAEARKKITAKFGKPKVQYKLRDWVFSRQRYWGEPIPLVHCEHCKEVVESTPHYLNFISENTWMNLLDGKKTIETRALNPEEPDRYFGNIKSDHAKTESYIKGIFKPTGATAYFRVKSVKIYKSLSELFADKKALAAVAPDHKIKNVKELKAAYEALAPGYVDKIAKNGLIAFEVKYVQPGIILLKDHELPLELPNVEKYEPTGTGESPLAAIDEWVNVTCRVCGHPAKRETNTMPQWAGSCWYYLRFTDPDNDKEFASAKAMKEWLPVSMYVGGAEHAVLHLLYARFWHKVLFDIGAIPKEVGDEPFAKLKNQGLILGPDGEKMSKSRGNVINPDDIIEQYGADTLRMYEMFMGPFEDAKPWDTNGIVGVRRFLERVHKLVSSLAVSKLEDKQSSTQIHRTVQKVTEGITSFRCNTVVSDLMIFFNGVDSQPDWRPKLNAHGEFEGTSYDREAMEKFLKLLSPLAPHLTEELWSILGHKTPLSEEAWPKYDPKKVKKETVTIAVQVMGKLRATLSMPTGANQATVESAAKTEPNVAKHLTSKPKKVIFIQDKLINFVI